jgi:hypothetical protein
MPEDPQGGGLEMQPTMGPEQNQYKLLLNVIPRGGKLERRPSIEAIRLGFGYPGRDATSNYGFQHNADGTSGLLADYGDKGGHTATPSEDENGQYVGRWWSKPSMVPVDHEQDLTASSPKYERQDIAEGIDVEIVNGKLICIYGARQRYGQTTGADSYTGATINTEVANDYDVRIRVSAHSLFDPSIGRLLISQTESANRKISTLKINNLHAYNVVRFWEKRISRIGTAFMLTGNGVGGSQWKTGYGWDTMVEQEFATDLAGVVTKTSLDVDDPHGLLLFNGGKLPFYKVDEPVYNMDRIDETNSVYTKKRPRNAFMFLDPEGQPIWYGFRRGDRMELQAGIDSANVLITSAQKGQLSDDGTKLSMDEGTLWFAETMNPHALPVQGFYTAVASSRSSEVVGLARFASGTACFTRDTIEFVQGYFSGYKGQIKLIHTGIGADSRWSIKEISKGVAFLNKDGVHQLMQAQGGSDVTRVTAFDPLFGDGVDFERTPYSDLVVGDTGTGETVPNHANTNSFLPDRYAQGLDAANVMRSVPLGTYRVDKTRLDRAVAGVWEDLYLCAVSRDIDDAGDENRLVLCWNYKENTASVWLLPKFMGMRGFAYDGSISAPYIMTRFGLAKFGSNKDSDIPFVKIYSGVSIGDTYNASTGHVSGWYTRAYGPWNTNDTAGVKDLDPDVNRDDGDILEDTFWLPVLVAGQTNFISGGGEAFVIPKIMITHEKNRYGWSRIVAQLQNDYADYKYDDDVDMRIQVWGNQTDIEAGTLGENYGKTDHSSTELDYDMKSLTMSDVGMLDSLYKGNNEKEFRAIRVNPVAIDGGGKTADHTHGHLRYGASPTTPFSALSTSYQPSRRTRGPILRTSTGRSGVTSTKQQVQFYTLDSGDILSVSFEIKVVVKPGGRG